MLAPDDVALPAAMMRKFYMSTVAADTFAYTIGSTRASRISHEAPWIASLRSQIAFLNGSGSLWNKEKPEIMSNVLSSFIVYEHSFETTAAILANVEDGKLAAKLVERLVKSADDNLKNVKAAQNNYEAWLKSAGGNMGGLKECLDAGWRDLGASERTIVNYSNAIISIQHKLGSLRGSVSLESISSGAVSDLSGVLSSVVSLVYNVVISGYAIPYLTVGSMFFTLGKLFYDIFSTSAEIHGEMNRLNQYRGTLSAEHQALAQTKASLQMLYDMKEIIVAQRNPTGEIAAFWEAEKRNLITVRDSFERDAQYSKTNVEILQLPIAVTVWSTLCDVSDTLLKKNVQKPDTRTSINIGT